MKFSNSYIGLGESFYERIRPTPVRDPRLFLWNSSLAEELDVPDELKNDPVALAQVFSGNRILPGSEPIATAYAGHQFGTFVPQLGDGRAHLLGEVLDQFGAKVGHPAQRFRPHLLFKRQRWPLSPRSRRTGVHHE